MPAAVPTFAMRRLARAVRLGVGLLACALAASPARAQAPAWTVDPASFERTMSVVASVSVGGVGLLNAGDRLAAFAGGQVRGVAAPTVVGGARVFFLPVYSNTDGEAVAFKVYDASANAVRDLAQTLSFSANSVQGRIGAPLALIATATGSTAPPPDTWTVTPSAFARSMSIVGAIRYADGSGAGVADRAAAFVGDEVRGVATSVEVDGERRFFLTAYAHTDGELLTFKVASGSTVSDLGGALVFAGDEVVGTPRAPHLWSATGVGGAAGGSDDPARWTVTPAGFDRSMNLVAALFSGGARSVDAADRVAAFVGDEVRGVAAPQQVGGAWLVFLTVYGRAEGEVVAFKTLDASANQVLPVAERVSFRTDAVVGSIAAPQGLFARSASSAADDPRTWAPTPATYEQTMNAIGQVRVGGAGAPVAGASSRVAAVVAGQVRGVTAPTVVAGQPLFFLTVYGSADADAVSYKTFDAATGRVYEVVQTSRFVADRVEGQVSAPLALTTPSDPTSLFVYPGDGNDDGRVNQSDLFPISFYFGLAGPARSDASGQFRAEIVRAWAPVAASSADMNGDGRVNQNDLFPLGFNFTRTRPADGFASLPGLVGGTVSGGTVVGGTGAIGSGGAAGSKTLAGSAVLEAVASAAQVRVGDTLAVSIRLSGAGAVRAAGLRMTYDAGVFAPLGRQRGALFRDALARGEALDLTKSEPGRLSYAATLSTPGAVGGASGGSEEIVVVRFRATAPASGDAVFRIDEAEAMNAGGSRIVLPSATVAVRVAAAAALPAPPALDAPADGALGVDRAPRLSWAASPTAVTYEVQLAASPEFLSLVAAPAALTGTTTAVGALAPLTRYHWRVRARSDAGAGAWSPARTFTTGLSVAASPAEALPGTLELGHPVPHPVRGAATLRFFLPTPQPVRLDVIDGLGRVVARLADGEGHGAGWHTVRVDAGALPAGVYLCRLEAGGDVRTQRMVLLGSR